MNKFIKRIGFAIAIACGSAVFVGGDYCAYASQREEHDPDQYNVAFLEAAQEVFNINTDGSLNIKRKNGTLGGIGAGNILWFLDTTQWEEIIILYSKEQQNNAEALAAHMRKTTKKCSSIFCRRCSAYRQRLERKISLRFV